MIVGRSAEPDFSEVGAAISKSLSEDEIGSMGLDGLSAFDRAVLAVGGESRLLEMISWENEWVAAESGLVFVRSSVWAVSLLTPTGKCIVFVDHDKTTVSRVRGAVSDPTAEIPPKLGNVDALRIANDQGYLFKSVRQPPRLVIEAVDGRNLPVWDLPYVDRSFAPVRIDAISGQRIR